MEHSFNIHFAKLYGIEEAIIAHNIFHWINKNIANEKHFYDGKYWTYNSVNAFGELFPYLNSTKIYRVLNKLVDNDILIKGNYNKEKFDNTCWYAFTTNGIVVLSNCGYRFSKMTKRIMQNEMTIPYSKHTDNKQEENKDNKLSLPKNKPKFNFKQSLLDLGVDEKIADDWLLVRKNKKATNSETAFNAIKKQIELSGVTANECITLSVERSWSGFKAEWLTNSGFNKPQSTYKPRTQDNRRLLKIEINYERNGELHLIDGTTFKNNHRYYVARDCEEYSIPVDAPERPDERWEYRQGEGWYLPYDLETANDIIW